MDSQPFRIQPQGPASAYQTFAIRRPQQPDAWVPASCEDVDCEHWRNGWVTRVPTGSELANAVRTAGRRWVSLIVNADGTTTFSFAAGTPCFKASQHRQLRRPDIPDLFVVRGGDWRGNPTGERRVHTRPDDWVEHFQEVTAAVADQIEKG